MTVTTVNEVTNQSSVTIGYRDAETTTTILYYTPNTSRGVNNAIPWCTSGYDFNGEHWIWIGTFPNYPVQRADKSFYLWQNGDQVCYNTVAEFSSNALCVPGDCAVGGNRKLTIGGNASAPTIALTPN